jgi:lipid A 4'-phosphatase
MPASISASTSSRATGRFLFAFLACSLALGLLAALAFLAFPEIDLQVSGVFYDGHRRFAGQSLGWVQSSRAIFIVVFWLCVAGSLTGLFMTRERTRTWLRFTFAEWLFLAICIATGPGFVANLVFKDHWGRARPIQIVEFGGAKAFTPALLPADQCANHCSFVSGEAASIFVAFYAASLLVSRGAGLLLVAGTVLGFAAGLTRMAQGAHFLSDVVFAGVFMALTVVVVYRAMFGPIAYRPARPVAAKNV